MKKHLKSFKHIISLCLILFSLFFNFPCHAFELTVPASANEIDVWDLVLEENCHYPIVPKGVTPQIQKKMLEQYNSLKKKGFEVIQMRNNEVIKITISTDYLFEFNSTNLNEESSAKYLNHFLEYLKVNGLYRVIIVVHHDNSLSPDEAEDLTYDRVFSIKDWFLKRHKNAESIIPYSMGNDMLITDDNSKKGRKRNRRLEIYLIPGELMIELASEDNL